MQREKRTLHFYFFFGAAGFPDERFWGGFACAKSEAATDLTALPLFGFDRIFPALLASVLLVVIEFSRRS